MVVTTSGLAGQGHGGQPSDNRRVSPLRRRMIRDMELAGLTPGTQSSYIAAVSALQKRHAHSRVDRLTEKDVYRHVLWLRDERGLAKGTFQTHFHGLKFFYYRCLGCDWTLFARKKVRQPRQMRLPVAISQQDCQRLMAAITEPVYRLCCASMYALGLRIKDAVTLRTSAIDAQRMVVRVIGKRNKERIVPLPQALLDQWRSLWKTHRHREWLFPNRTGTNHVCIKSLYRAFHKARVQAGLGLEIKPHCMRHGFATLLLEKGVDVRTVQMLLGHASMRSTEIYTHLTTAMQGSIRNHLNDMFDDAFAGGPSHAK